MSSTNDWKVELFEEKNLWQIFKKSPSILDNRFNRIIIIFSVFSIFSIFTQRIVGDSSKLDVITILNEWLQLAILLSSAMLGFLLAGFTIFATITKPELFSRLAQVQHKHSNLSELKFIFFFFINIFIHYLSYLFASVFLLLFFGGNGVAKELWGDTVGADLGLLRLFLVFILLIIGVWTAILLLKIKSFIWNLYQVVLLSIVDAAE